jgi:serine/threonine protein phosphatase 1
MAKPQAPAGQRIYCIGDIHGRADLLQQLHALVAADAAAYPGQKLLIYLGDYIDRGPDSRQVVDRLISGAPDGFEPVFLLGNHEQALLDFLQDARRMAAWLHWGGRETLRSYGISLSQHLEIEQLQAVGRELADRVPAEHKAFYASLRSDYSAGDYYFVHAGIRPGVALHKQQLGDKLWIREEFTRSQEQHPAVVVHGHSITPDVELLPNRIGIDTGAFYTGVLTALVLEDTSQRLLQTSPGAGN